MLVAVLWSCAGESDSYRVTFDVGPAIRALASDDLDIASPAEDRIVALGDAALPALHGALVRESEPVRLGIVEALARMPGDAVAELLLQTLRTDAAVPVRAEAAFALRGFAGAPVEAGLVAALRDPGVEVRARAATACGAACDAPASVALLTLLALDDPADRVWWAARRSLVRLRTGAASGPTAPEVERRIRDQAPARLADADEARAVRAALLLADVGDPQGSARLEAVVAGAGDLATRQQAIVALGVVGGPNAVGVLGSLRDDPQLRGWAALGLGHAASRAVPGAADALAGMQPAVPRGAPAP